MYSKKLKYKWFNKLFYTFFFNENYSTFDVVANVAVCWDRQKFKFCLTSSTVLISIRMIYVI